MIIKELKIYTQNLSSQIDFYFHKIGLDCLEESDQQVVFQVGKTKLRLVKSERSHPYHFAINIPCNQEKEALRWLKERVEILKDGNNEIQPFDSWNARAIYFYDPDQNIVEFIARKNLGNESQEEFGAHPLIEISEIGMPVNDIATAFKALRQLSDIEKYDGSLERFCAIGDENGLFICINKQLKAWFPTGDPAHSSAFEIKFQELGIDYELAFIDGGIIPFE